MQDGLGLVVAGMAHGHDLGPSSDRDLGEPGIAAPAGVGLEMPGCEGDQWPRSKGRPREPASSATNAESALADSPRTP